MRVRGVLKAMVSGCWGPKERTPKMESFSIWDMAMSRPGATRRDSGAMGGYSWVSGEYSVPIALESSTVLAIEFGRVA